MARTLEKFAGALETLPQAALTAHLQRGDFSRWVADVFGDYPLAAELRRFESRLREDGSANVAAELSQAIRSRYDVLDPCGAGPG